MQIPSRGFGRSTGNASVRYSVRTPATNFRVVQIALPVIGSVPIADLHKRDVTRVLSAILTRGSRVKAARVFEDVRSFLRWAVARGDVDADPVAGIRTLRFFPR
jgi:hypothetical protein